MRSSQIATWIAAAVGAGVGVSFALLGAWPAATPTREPPFRPIGKRITDTTMPAPLPSETVPPAASAEEPAPDPVAPPEPTSDLPDPMVTALAPSRELIEKDETACAWGEPDRCTRAARFYETGQGVEADPAKALDYLRRAVKLYAERCRERNARACYSLARLYQEGRGVEKSAEKGEALVDRTRELCRANQSAFCDAPDAPDVLKIHR